MTDHAALVATAQRLLPGTITAEHTYETTRDALYAIVKASGLPTIDRLHALYRLSALGAATGVPPYREWARRLCMEELPALQQRLEEAGQL